MTLNQMFRVKFEMSLTSEEIAEGSGVPVSTVRKIFGGVTKRPRRQSMEALSDYFEKKYYPEVVDFFHKQARTEHEKDYAYTAANPMIIRESSPYGQRRNSDFKIYTIDDYEKMPDYPRVELIDGVLYTMDSPSIPHQEVIGEMLYQIKSYIKKNNGKCQCLVAPLDVHIDLGDDTTLVQPDVMVVCDREKLKTNMRVMGAPDWVVEVLSPSTRSKDMNEKLRKYREVGVREYWMVDLKTRVVIIYRFESDRDSIAHIEKLDEPIPVGIYDGKLSIDFSEIDIFEPEDDEYGRNQ
ncbi:MAG: Uma2 family endonuclease [Eubacterium sp.]|nr:Uma2 family endonuclease [Eubacterium sp.]